jgi:hypothetical protein
MIMYEKCLGWILRFFTVTLGLGLQLLQLRQIYIFAVMAHSCWHCQQYILVQPRLDEEAYWVDVLEVEHQLVAHGAANGCAFFNWCLLQRPEHSLRQKHQDEVVLRGYMWAGVILKGSAGRRYLSLNWEIGPTPIKIPLGNLH